MTKLKMFTDCLLVTFTENRQNVVLIEPDSTLVDLDSLGNQLRHVGVLNINNYSDFVVTTKNCNGINEVSWISKNNENALMQMVRQSFTWQYSDTLLGDRNTISITDYEIYRRSKPYYVMLRISENNRFEKLIIDSLTYLPEKYERLINHTTYKPFFSEEIVGFQEAQEILESKMKACR